MIYTYLLDNNLYRQLTTSKNGQGLINFNNSIDQFDIIKKIASGSVAFRMTPFTLMEALGIKAPDPSLVIPPNLLRQRKTEALIDFVVNQSKAFYRNSPIIKKQHFLYKAEEQSKYTSFEATILEKICIYKPLEMVSFEEYIINFLSFDYLCKFDFPKEIQIDILHKFLLPSFFAEEALTSGLSKFRIAKKLWDIAYPQLLVKSDYSKEEIETMNKSMRLKKLSDYLDCELIHFVSIGDKTEQGYRPVVAYTCDDGQTVINRIRTYKSILELVINLLDESTFQSYKSTIEKWQQGIAVFCAQDCSFKNVIEVNKIHAFK